MLKSGLPAIADDQTRLFILGSLPGERSLRDGRYYAHPTNQFWKLVGVVIGQDLAASEYQQRLAVLAAHGIGLWDVVSAARREGSEDSAIRDAVHNPIGGLRNQYPLLEAIAFNGGHAARDGRRLMAGLAGIQLYDLVSSSGLARMSLSDKVAQWTIIARHLK
jgi:hypoxanthine-DNA glycosylase